MNIIALFLIVWNTLFYYPVVNVIVFLYKYTGNNLGLSIILLTILIRLILWPFMKSQIDSMKKMQAMKPLLDNLKKQYPDDKRKYQEEQLRLYRENGVNPVGSCLPLVVQLPFIYAVYIVIKTVSTSTHASVFNNILYFKSLQLPSHIAFNTQFLGINLAKDAAIIGFSHFNQYILYALLAVLVGITQYFASKVSFPMNTANVNESIEIIEEPQLKKGKKQQKKQNKKQLAEIKPTEAKKEDGIDAEEFSKTLSTQMLYILPIILTYISLGYSGSIPAGLSLYWIVQSVLVVIQTLILQGNLWKQK